MSMISSSRRPRANLLYFLVGFNQFLILVFQIWLKNAPARKRYGPLLTKRGRVRFVFDEENMFLQFLSFNKTSSFSSLPLQLRQSRWTHLFGFVFRFSSNSYMFPCNLITWLFCIFTQPRFHRCPEIRWSTGCHTFSKRYFFDPNVWNKIFVQQILN